MTPASRITACCTTAANRIAFLSSHRPQDFKPILSPSFWNVKNSSPRVHAFHSVPRGGHLQQTGAGEATSVQQGNHRIAGPGSKTRQHGSQNQQQQKQQSQQGSDLIDTIESFLSRSGRRRAPLEATAITTPTLTSKKTYDRHSIPTGKNKKRYKAAFQAGDFMCPRCGTHNFGDPDKHLRPFLARSIPRPPLASSQAPGAQDLSSLSSLTSDAVEKPVLDNHRSGSAEVEMQRPPLRTRERRKRIQGATSTCVECGYSTNATTIGFSPGPTAEIETRGSNADPRITRPREFVCDYCDTVNFSGRISCVGCGAIAPSLRDSDHAV